MPTFEAQILSPPTAFTAACKKINDLTGSDTDLYSKLCAEVTAFLKTGKIITCTENLSLINASRTLIFILKSWQLAAPQPSPKDVAVTLDSNTLLNRDSIAELVTAWTSNAEEFNSVLQAGRFENLKWRIGVTMESSTIKNLCAPYVALSFSIREENGILTPHTLELTYEQFRVRATIKLLLALLIVSFIIHHYDSHTLL